MKIIALKEFIKLPMKSVLLLAVLFLSMGSGYAQEVKIGYTNIELVLAYMPEARQMEQQLQTYQRKLGEQVQSKEQYGQAKMQEYQQMLQANSLSPEEQKRREEELQRLSEELQIFAGESEQKLLEKRQQLLEPILERLQNTINSIAAQRGYTYILNQSNSSGVSNILYGPEENDITKPLMKALGIELPN